MNNLLELHEVFASIGEVDILHGVSLDIKPGCVHVIMGPNGSGKSTLANIIMGNPKYKVTAGTISLNGNDITNFAPEERATLGVFMAFQYPREIVGVQMDRFLFTAYQSIMKNRYGEDVKLMSVFEFNAKLKDEMDKLGMKAGFVARSLNQGFSGGEKKKAEMLQLTMLDPLVAILDETDSGLDVDALKIVGESVNRFRENKEKSVLIVTHYQRLLRYVNPDFVHVMVAGKIVMSGGPELAQKLEDEGYEAFCV